MTPLICQNSLLELGVQHFPLHPSTVVHSFQPSTKMSRTSPQCLELQTGTVLWWSPRNSPQDMSFLSHNFCPIIISKARSSLVIEPWIFTYEVLLFLIFFNSHQFTCLFKFHLVLRLVYYTYAASSKPSCLRYTFSGSTRLSCKFILLIHSVFL